MKRLLLLLLLPLFSVRAQQGPQDIHPFFSPNGGCTQAVVDQLNGAKKSVLVQAYSFTSAPIAKALVDAHKRGVDVEVILDKSQRTERYTSATFLANEGVPTYIDSKHAIAHNKVMVIDGDEVITGSFNFTKAAEEGNAENLLVINNAPEIAQRYTQNWKNHLVHSESYGSRDPATPMAQVPPTSTPSTGTSTNSSTGYWLSNSGKRHNSSCKYYHNCAGHECGSNDGTPCHICGG